MDSLEKIIGVFNKIPVKPVSDVTFWFFAVLALGLSAQMTWKLIPSKDLQAPWKPTLIPYSSKVESSVDIRALQKLSLFGKPEIKTNKPEPKPVIDVVTEAPKTNLSIQLTGVVASTAEQNGLAIIESRGTQETYGLGDKIKGTSATLKEVFADRVIIANAGRYETLMLDGLKYTPGGQVVKPKTNTNTQGKIKKIDKRQNRHISEQIEQYREQIMQNPGKITDFISITPVRRDGAVVGYRLNPGKDGRFFREAGLKSNDLAKSINGYDLTDMNQAIEVMGQLPELTEVSVTVDRDGQLVQILFSLPQ